MIAMAIHVLGVNNIPSMKGGSLWDIIALIKNLCKTSYKSLMLKKGMKIELKLAFYHQLGALLVGLTAWHAH